jgi:hypothetical protein
VICKSNSCHCVLCHPISIGSLTGDVAWRMTAGFFSNKTTCVSLLFLEVSLCSIATYVPLIKPTTTHFPSLLSNRLVLAQ